jgi:hypothetical protein
MAACEENGDCRDGYECRAAEEILAIVGTDCVPIAGVLDDDATARFCAVPGNPCT